MEMVQDKYFYQVIFALAKYYQHGPAGKKKKRKAVLTI